MDNNLKGQPSHFLKKKLNLRDTKCGLFEDSVNNYLAASPDGIINQDSIVEVKCPFNSRNHEIKANKMFQFLTEDESGQLHLKKTHNYYLQIQGQLNVCRKQRYFCADQEYWRVCMLPKLELFYKKYYRKFVAEKL